MGLRCRLKEGKKMGPTYSCTWCVSPAGGRQAHRHRKATLPEDQLPVVASSQLSGCLVEASLLTSYIWLVTRACEPTSEMSPEPRLFSSPQHSRSRNPGPHLLGLAPEHPPWLGSCILSTLQASLHTASKGSVLTLSCSYISQGGPSTTG